MATAGSPRHTPSGLSGGTAWAFQLLPPSVEVYTDIGETSELELAIRTLGLLGSNAIAGSFCDPSARDTSTCVGRVAERSVTAAVYISSPRSGESRRSVHIGCAIPPAMTSPS